MQQSGKAAAKSKTPVWFRKAYEGFGTAVSQGQKEKKLKPIRKSQPEPAHHKVKAA